MVILSIFLGIAAIGFCCWLLFILAIFALPAFAGVTIGLWAHHAGAGVAGGIAVDAFLSHNWRANMRPTCRTTSVALAPARPWWSLLIDALLGLRSLPIKRPLASWRFCEVGNQRSTALPGACAPGSGHTQCRTAQRPGSTRFRRRHRGSLQRREVFPPAGATVPTSRPRRRRRPSIAMR